jgi:hypothetical protein
MRRPKRIHFHHKLYVRKEDVRPYIPRTPLCPICRTQTAIRTAHKWHSKGDNYWGCTRKGCDGKLSLNGKPIAPKRPQSGR